MNTKQQIIIPGDSKTGIDTWIREAGCKRILLVCTEYAWRQKGFRECLERLEKTGVKFIVFRDYQPNPLYENVQTGVSMFRNEQCDSIIAVGGGSAIDVAKCIKAYTVMEGDGNNGAWLEKPIEETGIPFLVVPTTAGTGSEATRYAVIYFDGMKQSITGDALIPDTVLLDQSFLVTLPLYQKKVTMMDALCHAIESFWSVNSTDESKTYSKKAIEMIMANMEGYLQGTDEGMKQMLFASNVAGKAINITQTTAGHAMCYKITSLFGYAHGHAAILCNTALYEWMIDNTDKCADPRGEVYLKKTLNEIGWAMGCQNARAGAVKLKEILKKLELEIPLAEDSQFEELKTSVNPVRLKNHPIELDSDAINTLYHKILKGAGV